MVIWKTEEIGAYYVEDKCQMAWCGPGFCNIMCSTLLKLDFSSHTKIVAFADDLAFTTNSKTPSDANVFENSDLDKIEILAKENKMQFNEIKSKTMLITRKRKNENTHINIYITIESGSGERNDVLRNLSRQSAYI
jgi:hypothetical protein